MAIFFGYIGQSSILYVYLRINPSIKIQKGKKIGQRGNEASPFHYVFTTINLVVSSLFSAFTCEMSIRGVSQIRFDEFELNSSTIMRLALEFTLAFCWQSVVEYWWHIWMHTDAMYATFHKHHHFYKSPEPFCDLFIHPLEAFGYQCILWSPAFVLPMHLYSFLVYMAVMGVCGVLDHSGIAVSVAGLYNTRDHDMHHELFNVNFGFPLPILDKVHGTYRHPRAE